MVRMSPFGGAPKRLRIRGSVSARGCCGHSRDTASWRAAGERYGPTTRPLETSLAVFVATA
eukprot:3195546-Prymnesium_polylepis.1